MTWDILRLNDADVTELSPEALNAISEEELSAMQVRALNSAPQTSLMPAFPLDVFPPWLARYVHEVARAVEVPEGIVGFALLGTLSAAYGTHLQIVLKHRYIRFCHDYFVLVADASIGSPGVL